jgi:hypothetical protein
MSRVCVVRLIVSSAVAVTVASSALAQGGNGNGCARSPESTNTVPTNTPTPQPTNTPTHTPTATPTAIVCPPGQIRNGNICVRPCTVPEASRITIQRVDRWMTGQPVFANSVPQCFRDMVTSYCVGFNGLINSEEISGPPGCQFSTHGHYIPGGQADTNRGLTDATNYLNYLAAVANNSANYLNQGVAYLNSLRPWPASWWAYYYGGYIPALTNYNNAVNAFNSYRDNSVNGYAYWVNRMNRCNEWHARSPYIADDCAAAFAYALANGQPVWYFSRYAENPAERPAWLSPRYDPSGTSITLRQLADGRCELVDPATACVINALLPRCRDLSLGRYALGRRIRALGW